MYSTLRTAFSKRALGGCRARWARERAGRASRLLLPLRPSCRACAPRGTQCRRQWGWQGVCGSLPSSHGAARLLLSDRSGRLQQPGLPQAAAAVRSTIQVRLLRLRSGVAALGVPDVCRPRQHKEMQTVLGAAESKQPKAGLSDTHRPTRGKDHRLSPPPLPTPHALLLPGLAAAWPAPDPHAAAAPPAAAPATLHHPPTQQPPAAAAAAAPANSSNSSSNSSGRSQLQQQPPWERWRRRQSRSRWT